VFRQEIMGITGGGGFAALLAAAERDIEKHQHFICGDHDDVRYVEAGIRDDGDIVIHVEVKEAVH
jgi:hypothetical protein